MPETVEQLRACAAAFLRYTKQCPVIAFERGVDWHIRPDVLAVTKSRYLIEIEIKLTLADFKADRKKRRWHNNLYGGVGRRQFYYCVPQTLVEKVEGIVPTGCGLMMPTDHVMNGINVVRVIKRAPLNRKAPRLSLKQIVEMVRNQSGTLCSLAKIAAKNSA